MRKTFHLVSETLKCALANGLYATAVYIAVVNGADFIRNTHPAPDRTKPRTCKEMTFHMEPNGAKVMQIPSGDWNKVVYLNDRPYVCGWAK